MSREVYAGDSQTGAARDLQIHDGETDGNPNPAVKHLVQKTVARVIVALSISAEPLLFVQIFVERAHCRLNSFSSGSIDTRRRFLTQRIKQAHVRRGIERRILDASDRERGGRQLVSRCVDCTLQLLGDLCRAGLEIQREMHERSYRPYAGNRPRMNNCQFSIDN
jgi:hypothetical protein